VDRENMKVRVHPQDFQYMLEIKSDFLQSFDGIKNIVFEEDMSILRGGAIIETMFGEVDARLDHQYNEIKSSMTTSHRGG
jgi:flagellar assembly protein FliH